MSRRRTRRSGPRRRQPRPGGRTDARSRPWSDAVRRDRILTPDRRSRSRLRPRRRRLRGGAQARRVSLPARSSAISRHARYRRRGRFPRHGAAWRSRPATAGESTARRLAPASASADRRAGAIRSRCASRPRPARAHLRDRRRPVAQTVSRDAEEQEAHDLAAGWSYEAGLEVRSKARELVGRLRGTRRRRRGPDGSTSIRRPRAATRWTARGRGRPRGGRACSGRSAVRRRRRVPR